MTASQIIIGYKPYFKDNPDAALIEAMIDAGKQSADVLRKWFHKAAKSDDRATFLGTTTKTEDMAHLGYEDAYTKADLDAENTIIPILKAAANIPIVAEESGHEIDDALIPNGNRRWLIDPIDGTFCFKNGYPDFSTTIALQKKVEGKWVTEIGLVCVPMHNEIYLADSNRSYLIHGERAKPLRIHGVNAQPFNGGTLDESFKGKQIETVIYAKHNPTIDRMREGVCATLNKHGALQATYSTAMMLSKMAAGWCDGAILASNALEFPWDTDAALHIAEKAGAKIKRLKLDGEPVVVVGNSETMVSSLQQLVERQYHRAKSNLPIR